MRARSYPTNNDLVHPGHEAVLPAPPEVAHVGRHIMKIINENQVCSHKACHRSVQFVSFFLL